MTKEFPNKPEIPESPPDSEYRNDSPVIGRKPMIIGKTKSPRKRFHVSTRSSKKGRQKSPKLKGNGRLSFIIGLSLILVFSLIAIFASPLPLTLVTASAKTEWVKFTPSGSSPASIQLSNAWLLTNEGRKCVNDAEISLNLSGDDRDSLEITRSFEQPNFAIFKVTSGSWSSENLEPQIITEPVEFVISNSGNDCLIGKPMRIQVNGFVTIGELDQFRPLLSATIRVFGRVSEKIFGVIPMKMIPGAIPGTLYSSEFFEVSPNSQIVCALRSGFRKEKQDKPKISEACKISLEDTNLGKSVTEAKWLGYIDLDLDSKESGFDLELSTNAEQVLVTSPLPADAQIKGAPDIISVSMGAKLMGDPFLRFFGSAILLALTILTAVANIGAWHDARPK